ncbi:MAG: SpoIIE family protein phosphatase [Saprospiraceae bacterium]
MSETSTINTVQQLRQLEHQLSLKQMQIQRLLNITQAINNNMSSDDLFIMYREFLRFEMGMSKVLLLIREAKDWYLAVEFNLEKSYNPNELAPFLGAYHTLYTVKSSDPEILQEFDIVIPVHHKDYSIAYALVKVSDKEDLYHKIQFIQTITNIIAVASENKRLFKNQVEQERMNKEIELAREVQSLLIPQSLPQSKTFEVSSIYRPHFNVGGDYFDCLVIEPERYLICMADISGKGVSAALLMSNLQANIRQLVKQFTSIENLVVQLNEALFDITGGDRFLTLFIADVCLTRSEIHYINCGHISPLIFHQGQIIPLSTGTTVIGAFEKLPFIDSGTLEIKGESMLLVFTDGLTDLINSSSEYFDLDHIENFLKKYHKEGATSFNTLLMEELEKFKGNQTFPDDITVLACKIDTNTVS